jgi:ABC-2 type transport system permease protein
MIDLSRWMALFKKELRQIGRNRRLIIMLIIPPTVNIVLFGFALDPTVTDLELGVLDQSRSAESRRLVSALTESLAFRVARNYLSEDEITDDIRAGELDAALIIPPNYDRQRARNETARVQFIVDAVDSNTATIAAGYAGRVIADLNRQIRAENRRPPQPAMTQNSSIAMTMNVPPQKPVTVNVNVALLYNPGLKNSWFIVTGLIGALLVLQGSIVAAASMVVEKEVGTIEQLLMTPAEAGEIITAKIAPIFLLLTADIGLALIVAMTVFGIPIRGNLLFFYVSGALCVFSGIGIGTLIATFVKSQQQAQLMSFFVNPPLVLLSGATTPIEAMPGWLQPITLLNPIRHFATISRGILLKGTGMEILYPNFLALLTFCILLVGISAWQFRRQLR